jgi:hypothetical protein
VAEINVVPCIFPVKQGIRNNLGVDALTANTRSICGLWPLEFARRSPDAEMRATLKLVRAEELADG